MSFPVKLKDIALFERPYNISVNAYGLETNFKNNKKTYAVIEPLRSTESVLWSLINLLYVTDDRNSNGYYCWTEDLSRLAKPSFNT